MNRFGFSTKKPDYHENAKEKRQYSAISNRISSHGPQVPNPDFTPTYGIQRKTNKLFSNEKCVPMISSLSTGKKFTSRLPSLGSTGRLSKGMMLNSERKSSASSKLKFGMTPQHSRASYMQQNAASTSRLSRASNVGRNKDSRQLSDANFHRQCRDEILQFLMEFDFSIPQNLLRPSMNDISRIYQFLLSHFYPEINIETGNRVNNKLNAIDVIVPKYLTELGYPYQLKRSDLISCSGGRQLGTILDSYCYIIEIIKYIGTESMLHRSDFESDIDFQENQIDTFLNNLVLNYDGDESYIKNDKDICRQVEDFVDKIYGTKAELDELETERSILLKKLEQLDDESARRDELPKKLEAYYAENAASAQYLVEIDKNIAEYEKNIGEVKKDLENQNEIWKQVSTETENWKEKVDSQKEVVMQYRLAVERKAQINGQMQLLSENVNQLDNNIISMSTLIYEKRAQSIEMLGELEETIKLAISEMKYPKINNFAPDFYKLFEDDEEWKQLQIELEKHKKETFSDNDNIVEFCQSFNHFGKRLEDKIKDFKQKIIQRNSSLKSSDLLELNCKKLKQMGVMEEKQKLFAELDQELKNLMAEMEVREKSQRENMHKLDLEIKCLTQRCLEFEKKLAVNKSEHNSLNQKNEELMNIIENKQQKFMKTMNERLKDDRKFINKTIKTREELYLRTERLYELKKCKLEEIRQYKFDINK
ncbi:hypothetical protein RDWZM_006943 [Blomia tropicalis]|uniref:Kinetochore protein NDC80 n=1 Tax=Blomia tropicalis TaxID=40697 RepID=A0A9Q0M811_BLOTA|nr:kinetochore-associated Ndc80 complex subunit ndc80 [Blomia tropicalis]KAJ6221131.1 hypothetical protein RDWZM_006943 [Blomia tropicalis]